MLNRHKHSMQFLKTLSWQPNLLAFVEVLGTDTFDADPPLHYRRYSSRLSWVRNLIFLGLIIHDKGLLRSANTTEKRVPSLRYLRDQMSDILVYARS